MSKDLWIMEVEQAQEAFMEDGDEEAFTSALKSLGFDPDEIMDEIAAGKDELTTIERAADQLPNMLTGKPMFHVTRRPPRRI